MTLLFASLRTLLVAIVLMVGGAAAHEGHDHANETKAPLQAGSTPRLEAASGPFALVALLRQDELVIYLDRFDTNAPITAAAVTVETPDGSVTAEPRDGVYRVAAAWARSGSHDLIFTVTAENDTEILSGTLMVAPREPEPGRTGGWSLLSPAMAQGLKEALGSGNTVLVAIVAFAAGVLATVLVRRGVPKLLAAIAGMLLLLAPEAAQSHDGHDHGVAQSTPQPAGDVAQRFADGALFVPKPTQRILGIRTVLTQAAAHSRTLELPGRIIPDPNASGFVQASVSGRLSPPTGGFPKLGTSVRAGDVLAFVTPPFQAIDVSDMRQKAGELDQQIDIVSKRVARYTPLATTGAINKVTLDEAILELNGLRERRAALDKIKVESERLIAPVSGIVAAANAVAGQIAETNAVVFQIVDPARLWVEALTFSLLPDAQPATALTGEGRRLRLSFRGAGLTDRSQAIPVHFAIEGEEKGLRVGQLVTVMAVTGAKVQGLAVPRTSVLRTANGQTVLFEHSAAERFEPRTVRVEPLDAERMLVVEGFTDGRRVVVQGAELLNQIR